MGIMNLLQRKPEAQEMMPMAISEEIPTEEYVALANKLGVAVGGLTRTTTLESVLQDEHVRVFPLKSVERYMDRQTPKGKVWGWMSVRALDYERAKGYVTFGYNDKNGRFLTGTYEKPIPFPVLLTMDKIEAAMSHLPVEQRPAFFITDYAVPSPDPFLMVAVPGVGMMQEPHPNGELWHAIEGACFVIERWDEPSFR